MEEATPFERALDRLSKDPSLQRDVNFGRRVALYKLGKELGAGNFSKVKIGQHVLTKEKVAVKIIDRGKMDQKSVKLLNREVEHMDRANHPNIVRLFEVIETLSKLYLVMEYAGGGELYDYVLQRQKLSEQHAAVIYVQIVSAVKHLVWAWGTELAVHNHDCKIVHRDIKAENVFIAGHNWVKLGDFGFSCSTKKGALLKTFCGSPPYAAPELFRDAPYKGESVDLWALGVLLYFLTTGYMPFRGSTVSDMKQRVLEGEFAFPEHLSLKAQSLISTLLSMDPDQRGTGQDILDHDFLVDCEGTKRAKSMSAYPNQEDLELVPIAADVYERLGRIGITQNVLGNAAGNGAKDAAIGVYRIICFMSQRELAEKNQTRRSIIEVVNDPSDTQLSPKSLKRSRVCSLM